jgi:hypothetical protein
LEWFQKKIWKDWDAGRPIGKDGREIHKHTEKDQMKERSRANLKKRLATTPMTTIRHGRPKVVAEWPVAEEAES